MAPTPQEKSSTAESRPLRQAAPEARLGELQLVLRAGPGYIHIYIYVHMDRYLYAYR